MSPSAVSMGIVRGLLAILLLGIIWAALHDILSGEADRRMEIVAVAISVFALGLLVYGWSRGRRGASSGEFGPR